MNLLPWLISLHLTATLTVADAAPPLCAPNVQAREPMACAALGPGHYTAQLAAARLPSELPDPPTQKLTRFDPLVEYAYARVTTLDAPLFASPDEAAAGIVKRTIGKGFLYVTLSGAVQLGDLALYQIRTGEYIRASDVKGVTPTAFQGVGVTGNPALPFGWLLTNVRPSRVPGETPSQTVPRLPRRKIVQIFATHKVGPWEWYLIGPDQWIEQRVIAKIETYAPPAGVSGKWVMVNLYEQTLTAYEDDQMIFATLVSSGLDKWPTRPGLFKIWARLLVDGMQGSYEPDGSDFYSLEAVPWVMYFDGSRALHGEYWHDRLGFKRSHGCVNLAPQDAHWLYNWAEKGTPVWVYDPSGQTPTDEEVAEGP